MNVNKLCSSSLVCLALFLGNHVSAVEANVEQQQLSAALIYKMYFYIDYPFAPKVPHYCFVGSESFAIADILTDRQKSGQIKSKIKISTWAAHNKITERSCQIIYTAPSVRTNKSIIQKLSKNSLTLGDDDDLSNNGNISSLTFKDNRPVLTFSRKQLKSTLLQVNSQLLSNSIMLR